MGAQGRMTDEPARPAIRCPVCFSEDECDHDLDERYSLCEMRHVEPEPLPEGEHNIGDRRQVRRRDRDVKRRQEERVADLRWLLQHPQGQRFLYRVLAMCGVLRSPVPSEGPIDAFRVMLHVGEQNIGRQLFDEAIRHAPDLLYQLLQLKDPDHAP